MFYTFMASVKTEINRRVQWGEASLDEIRSAEFLSVMHFNVTLGDDWGGGLNNLLDSSNLGLHKIRVMRFNLAQKIDFLRSGGS